MEDFAGQRKKRIILFGILTLLIMIIIFIFSSMDAELSGTVSGFLADIIDRLGWGDLLPDIARQNSTDGRLRKCAHVTVYFLLGLSACALFKEHFLCRTEEDGVHTGNRFDFLKVFVAAVALSFLYACSDEWHQTFVAGRSGKFADVGIDAIGFVAASVLSIWITYVRHKKEENRGGRL